MSVLYNLSKVNVVADVHSQLSMGSVDYAEEDNKELVRDVHKLD